MRKRKYNDVDLVIDMREGGDWSLDLLFAGLVNNLGPEGVFACPRKWKHTEWDDPRVGHGTTSHDWGLERRTLGYTPLNRFVADPLDGPSRARTLAGMGRLQRIWIDERMESFQFLRSLGPWFDKVPVVVVAGHDRFWNHSPQFVASLYGDRLEAMLLDNWYEEYAKLPFKTRRIGWSTNFDHYWTRPDRSPEKNIDISFIGYNSHPDRARFIDHVNKRWGHLNNHIFLETKPDSFDNFVPKERMFNIMQRSQICLNIRGAADRGKTLRAYEIPYVGSFMLSQKIGDPGMMDDFVLGEHCDYFRIEDELDASIDWALKNAEHREKIALVGHQRAIGSLSTKERWADVLRWLEDGRSVQETV